MPPPRCATVWQGYLYRARVDFGPRPQLYQVYCQNLCLFGKLFIETKYIFFDVEGFMFYLITDATPSFDHVLGFFSKVCMVSRRTHYALQR